MTNVVKFLTWCYAVVLICVLSQHHLSVVVCAVLSGFEMCNKYQIKNSLGQLVYFATEGLSLFLAAKS